MKKRISQNDLEKFYNKELKSSSKKTIFEKLEKRRSESRANKEISTIFLSHSHLDKTIVSKIGLLFEKINAELYVDWLDKTLPESTNKSTAVTIKTKIKECHNFLFLATYHGLRSKWCNWELGIADTNQPNGNLAILPIGSKSGNWSGNEYLQLYPEMEFASDDLDTLSIDEIRIKQLSGQYLTLKEWLSI